jgi:hypothetical protein
MMNQVRQEKRLTRQGNLTQVYRSDTRPLPRRRREVVLTRKRGFVISWDLSDALDQYIEASGMRFMDVIDAAVKEYIAKHAV